MSNTSSKTSLLGIIGTPILHTLSPVMHSFMAQKTGIDASYLAFDVKDEDFGSAIEGLKALGGRGFNITAPYKIKVLDYLDEVSSDAKIINSVNTIVNKNGAWHGYNTDGDGYCESLILEGEEISGKNIVIMGAGGSARSISYKLAKNNANSISMISRNIEKVHVIGDMIEKYTGTSFFDVLDKTKKYDIVINTTPVGMHSLENENPCGFMEIINENTVCSDVIYNPNKTLFLKESEEKGAKIHNGLGMLIMQGILAFEHFFDITLDKKVMYEEVSKLLKNYRI
ncbi:MAG: shikimate dehydrogenase [Clostridia bacterium]|nr:shikimate dehydrogenase [Clostridia bacterium]